MTPKFKQIIPASAGQFYGIHLDDTAWLYTRSRDGWTAEQVVVETEEEAAENRWLKALREATTTGASAETARQDDLPPGVDASRALANRDFARVNSYIDVLREAARQTGMPVALLAGSASRESRAGAALDRDGWGDRGNAFGMMQVDQRYHAIQGLPDKPFGIEHVGQAANILRQCLLAVMAKHPGWSDANKLKGACVAYNAGIKTVQTVPGMDRGTTGNDYGSDVIARAQFYLESGVA